MSFRGVIRHPPPLTGVLDERLEVFYREGKNSLRLPGNRDYQMAASAAGLWMAEAAKAKGAIVRGRQRVGLYRAGDYTVFPFFQGLFQLLLGFLQIGVQI